MRPCTCVSSPSPRRRGAHAAGHVSSRPPSHRDSRIATLLACARPASTLTPRTPQLPSMDDVLTAQFDRVERALSSLVDSIAAYNPSPQAALDLVVADDELSHGLDQRMLHPRAPPPPDGDVDTTQLLDTKQTTLAYKLYASKPTLSKNNSSRLLRSWPRYVTNYSKRQLRSSWRPHAPFLSATCYSTLATSPNTQYRPHTARVLPRYSRPRTKKL